jgi:hypothetical protein
MADSVKESAIPQEDMASTVLDVSIDVPATVDAGGTFSATVRVATDPPTDLRGERFDVLDGDEVVAAGVPLIDVDEHGVHTSASAELKAPAALGAHTWTVELEPSEAEHAPYDAASTPFAVEVKAHDIRVQAWGAPTAIPAGQTFQVKVGIKCSSGCDLSGQGFDIVNEAGNVLATGIVGQETWKGTKGLFYTDVEVTAPGAEGYEDWRVQAHPSDAELPHDEGSTKFGVKTVPAPKHTVRVTALDQEKGEPIAGLQVLMHPFRAFTDERGVAEVRVPEGEYRLYVSGLRYFPHDSRIEVSEDQEASVELVWEKRLMKIR